MTIAELSARLATHIGKEIVCPLTHNKGAAGLLLETLTGIPHTSNCLDCTDGELKVYPVVRHPTKGLVPKETVAVTMVSPDDLRASDYESSRPGKKMGTVLFVPYERKGDNVVFLSQYTFRPQDHPDIAATLRADYDAIRQGFIADGTLTSSTGTLLQNRTKGAGHGSTSRAFYLRTEFMQKVIPNPTGPVME